MSRIFLFLFGVVALGLGLYLAAATLDKRSPGSYTVCYADYDTRKADCSTVKANSYSYVGDQCVKFSDETLVCHVLGVLRDEAK